MGDIPSPRAEWGILDRPPDGDDPPDDFEGQIEGDLAELPAPLQRRPIPPPLTELQTVLAEALAADLLNIKNARSEFASFCDGRIAESASLLVRHGLETVEAFRTTGEQARRFLFEDLRKTEQLNFIQLSFPLKHARHIPPHDKKLSAGNIRFTELDTPRELASYSPLLSNLSSHLLPDQDMVNWVQKEIALAEARDPPFFFRALRRSFPKPLGYLWIPTAAPLAPGG